MAKLLVLADDFTGALDSGVKFAQKGVATRVLMDASELLREAEHTEVIVVHLPTRHLPAKQAYDIVYDVVRTAAPVIPHILKKTDSILRGNVGSELAAVRRASGERMLAFFPAYPEMGRVTSNGVQRLDGVPIQDTVFGQDPFEPVRESDVCAIIGAQSDENLMVCPQGVVPPEDFSGIAVFDGETNEQMRIAAHLLKEHGGMRVIAGCAGIASVLPEVLQLKCKSLPAEEPTGHLFVVCGSMNLISLNQIAYAEQRGFPRVDLDEKGKCSPFFCESEAYRALLGKLIEFDRAGRPFILSTGCTEDRTNVDSARTHVADICASLVKALIDCGSRATMMVTGGDTLYAIMERMGLRRIDPIRELAPGVVLSATQYRGERHLFISKSGGFGGEDLIVRLAKTTLQPIKEGRKLSC